MKTSTVAALCAAMLTLSNALPVLANTSSVFSPDVKDGDRSFEYRGSYEPNDDGEPDVDAHRLHYQHAFNDRTRLRFIALQSDKGDGMEFRYTRFELQQQYKEDETDGWDAALRFELQIAEGDDLPHRARVAWTGKVDIGPRWQLRSNVLVGREFDSGADPGLALETRWQASYRLGDRARLGVEMFNDLNNTADFGSFDEQEHQAGPILKLNFGGGWRAELSYLVGVSSAAPDDNLRLQIRHTL